MPAHIPPVPARFALTDSLQYLVNKQEASILRNNMLKRCIILWCYRPQYVIVF
jgi:hypothetical protein